MSHLEITYLLTAMVIVVICLSAWTTKHYLDVPINFRRILLSMFANAVIIAVCYYLHPVIGIVSAAVLNMYHLGFIYMITQVDLDEHDKYIADINLIDVAEEYIKLEDDIQSIVNSPKPHSDLQVAEFIRLRTRQLEILEHYRELNN